ncbi:unnamed protein product [Sphagnum balticum]
MEHLPFASAFWVLQVIVSLRCKFQGVYTQEQLIGSKKDSSGCWHNTGMSSHPSDHTCDSAPTLVHASGWAELDGIIDQSIDPDLGLYEPD